MICPEAIVLFDLYQETLAEFHAARLRLPDAGDYETCFAKLSARRTAYWEHVRAHGCRTSSIRPKPDAIEQRLRQQMEEARRSYNEAYEICKHLSDMSADAGPIPDGSLAQQQANRIRAEAVEQYKEALKRFTDYVLRTTLPGEIDS